MRSSKRVAVVLVGHGSKTLGFDGAMKKVALAIRRKKGIHEVRCAFLEVTAPSIPQAIEDCVRRHASEVRVLPYFVLTGKHVLQDIPRIVREVARHYRGKAKIVLCPYLGYHPKIVSVVKERIGRV